MAVTVFIPAPLRAFTDHQAQVQVDGTRAGEVLQNLATRTPNCGGTCSPRMVGCAAS